MWKPSETQLNMMNITWSKHGLTPLKLEDSNAQSLCLSLLPRGVRVN